MRKVPSRMTRLCTAIALLVTGGVLAGCGQKSGSVDEAIDIVGSGAARQDIQAWFDTHRQCAIVLTTTLDGNTLSADSDSADAAALVRAGLIERTETPEPEAGKAHFRIKPDAARWFETNGADAPRQQLLCYARRKVTTVTVDPAGPSLTYLYELDQPAPWMSREVRAAFPAIDAALKGSFAGRETIRVHDGKPVLNDMQPTYGDPTLYAFRAFFDTAVRR